MKSGTLKVVLMAIGMLVLATVAGGRKNADSSPSIHPAFGRGISYDSDE